MVLLMLGLAALAVSACDASPSPSASPTTEASGAAVESVAPDATPDPAVVALLVRIRAAEVQGFSFVRDLGQAPSNEATGKVLTNIATWAEGERRWVAGNAVPACSAAPQSAYLAAVNGVAASMAQFQTLFLASPRPPDSAFDPALQAFSDSINAFEPAEALAGDAVRTCRA
jgi:hypothetical protein